MKSVYVLSFAAMAMGSILKSDDQDYHHHGWNPWGNHNAIQARDISINDMTGKIDTKNTPDAKWTGIVNGETVTFTGTIEQLRQKYPDESFNSSSESASLALFQPPTKTTPDTVTTTACNILWTNGPGDESVLEDGVRYLSGLGKTYEINLAPGPVQCSRVSCSYGSGIFFCNSNKYKISVLAHEIAEYAQAIIGECTDTDTGRTLGYRQDSANWFVIAGGANC